MIRPPHHRLWQWLRKTCLQKGMRHQLWLVGSALLVHSAISVAALGIETPPREPDMLWPLLPGESLQSLAVKLYPQSPILQQRFIQQALSFSRHRGIVLQADTPTQRAQLIAVPDAATLHKVTRRIKKAEELDAESEYAKESRLVMSLQITQEDQPAAKSQPLLSRLHWPTLAFPKIDGIHQFLQTHTQQVLQPAWQHTSRMSVHAVENYRANALAIARTPLGNMYKKPQLAVIVGSAVLLLVLSLVWGVLETRRDKR